MTYSWLTDKELEAKCEEFRARAHNANQQNYAARAHDWEVASNELERRKAIRKDM